jgi:uncharacterized protein YdhG (YjbR/CyaY superfamily)
MAEVTEYVAGLDEPARSLVQRYFDRATTLVPAAEEGTSYGMASLRYRGKGLVSVVATRQGYSVYPFSADVVAHVVDGRGELEHTKGGIRFTDLRPLADDVFDRMVLDRRDEIDTALAPAR